MYFVKYMTICSQTSQTKWQFLFFNEHVIYNLYNAEQGVVVCIVSFMYYTNDLLVSTWILTIRRNKVVINIPKHCRKSLFVFYFKLIFFPYPCYVYQCTMLDSNISTFGMSSNSKQQKMRRLKFEKKNVKK